MRTSLLESVEAFFLSLGLSVRAQRAHGSRRVGPWHVHGHSPCCGMQGRYVTRGPGPVDVSEGSTDRGGLSGYPRRWMYVGSVACAECRHCDMSGHDMAWACLRYVRSTSLSHTVVLLCIHHWLLALSECTGRLAKRRAMTRGSPGSPHGRVITKPKFGWADSTVILPEPAGRLGRRH